MKSSQEESMSQRLLDLSESSVIYAIEANTREFLLALGRLGGGEERDEPTIQWSIGGAPIAYHNCVVRAHLTAETVDEAIVTSAQRFQVHNIAGSWHVGPSMRPLDIGTRLLAHGFADGGDEPGMAADLLHLHEHVSTPGSFSIEQVRSNQELQVWTQTLAAGFGEGEVEANWVGAMYQKIGFDEQGLWRHYLGRWDGQPVATTSLFLGAGVAGIYFVFTLPQARGRGFGAAITLAALQDARKRGYRVWVLAASSMGYPVYRRLGFQEYCRFHLYEWVPRSMLS
jgi:GNAT superfamily N-acetyltransferase